MENGLKELSEYRFERAKEMLDADVCSRASHITISFPVGDYSICYLHEKYNILHEELTVNSFSGRDTGKKHITKILISGIPVNQGVPLIFSPDIFFC